MCRPLSHCLSFLYLFCRSPPRILRSPSLQFFKSLLQRFPPKKAKPSHTILNRIPVNMTFRIFHLTYCISTLCLFFSVSSLCYRLSLIVWCVPLCIECAWCLAGTLIRVCLWTHWQDSLQILFFSPCVLYLRRMIYMIEFWFSTVFIYSTELKVGSWLIPGFACDSRIPKLSVASKSNEASLPHDL